MRISAQEAVIGLMSLAFIEIRTISYRRDLTLLGWIDGPEDYHEQIRVIADICHNLPGSLSSRSKRQRERRASESLRLLLLGADDAHTQWVRTRLDELGYDYHSLLGKPDREVREEPKV